MEDQRVADVTEILLKRRCLTKIYFKSIKNNHSW